MEIAAQDIEQGDRFRFPNGEVFTASYDASDPLGGYVIIDCVSDSGVKRSFEVPAERRTKILASAGSY